MMGDDSMSDDVFEMDEEKMVSVPTYVPPHQAHFNSLASERLSGSSIATPSTTGYRDYKPPAEVLQAYQSKSRLTDSTWTYKRDYDNSEIFTHKVSTFFEDRY